MSLVTIAIPTFNRAGTLAQAVRSAAAQDYPDVEVVVVDNASTDATAGVCAALAGQEPRVRVVRHGANIGAIGNFEAALAQVRGEYFMWLADDDRVDPNYVSACVARLEAGAVLAGGRCEWFGAGGLSELETPMRLLAADPVARVRQFYGEVIKNSVFYGVMRTADARRVFAHIPGTGGDWLLVSALAFSGPVDTVEVTTIHRAYGGSSDLVAGAWRSIPAAVARDILTTATYDPLPRRRRLGLAAACAWATAWRLAVWFPLLAWLRRLLPEVAYLGVWRAYRRARGGLRSLYGRIGRFRSRSEMVSAPASGHEIASEGSSQRMPAAASGT